MVAVLDEHTSTRRRCASRFGLSVEEQAYNPPAPKEQAEAFLKTYSEDAYDRHDAQEENVYSAIAMASFVVVVLLIAAWVI